MVQRGVQFGPIGGDPGPHFGDAGIRFRGVDVDAADDPVFIVKDGVGEADSSLEVVSMPSQVTENASTRAVTPTPPEPNGPSALGSSGRLVSGVVAPSSVRGRDSRAGPRRGSSEIVPSDCGCRLFDRTRVGGIEFTLVAVRDHPQDAPVQVAHDRAPPGSGTGSAMATASGSE